MVSKKTLLWFDTTAESLWRPCGCCSVDETYGTYVDDGCFDIHDNDDDTDHDTDDDTDDDADDDTNDDTNDGGRGNLYTIKAHGCCSWVPGPCGPW